MNWKTSRVNVLHFSYHKSAITFYNYIFSYKMAQYLLIFLSNCCYHFRITSKRNNRGEGITIGDPGGGDTRRRDRGG